MSSKSVGAKRGKVYLVGAGPGDVELATVKAVRLVTQADVVVFDALANPALLENVRPDAELVDAGKRAKAHTLTQDQINQLLVDRARAGKTVVRLKGGDPYVFGRGSEEAIFLHEQGVEVEVVPGLTSALAAPAYAGIPVTHRGIATTVTLITGHEDPTKSQTQVDYLALAQLAAHGGTLCFYMGMGRLQVIADQLMQHGLGGDTPAAVVQWGTLAKQRSVRTTVLDLQAAVDREGMAAPAIIVIGQVVGVDTTGALNWFEQRPLFGKTLVVTRTRQQVSELRWQLESLGAEVLEAPTIRIISPEDWAPVDAALRGVKSYDWLVLTSVNGVHGLRQRLAAMELDSRHLAGVKVAAIGGATAEALEGMGIRPDLVPAAFVAESLAAELIAREPMKGKRVLMLRADIARSLLREKLCEVGATVDDVCIYQTLPAEALPEEVLTALRESRVDMVTFASSSTVRNFIELLGGERSLLDKVPIASIGPITTQTVLELGLRLEVQASVFTVEGLVEAIERHYASKVNPS